MGNVADILRQHAVSFPEKPALIAPKGSNGWHQMTYGALNETVDALARGFTQQGIRRGDRVLFLVKPGFDFYTSLFALFRMGAVPILIDPGMGLSNVLQCVEQIQPRVLVAIAPVHVIRLFRRHAFQTVQIFVTVGKRWFWGGTTLKACTVDGDGPFEPEGTFTGEEEGFIAFTSGSTGAPKGVSFLHSMFHHQARMLGSEYGLGPTDTTVECFAAFVIYDLILGMTTVLPDMNMSKPATAKPQNILDAIHTHRATTAFASPVVWGNLVRAFRDQEVSLPTLKRILTAGAPIPASMHRGLRQWVQPGVELYTPYGATESLPVTSIGSTEVLEETWARTIAGHGTCVGRPFEGVTVRLIRITDEPIATLQDSDLVAEGELGEIVIDAPIVSPEYKDRPTANRGSKVRHEGRILHRIGDLGYFDAAGRLWFCGRKSHALWTEKGLVPAVPVEGVANELEGVRRTALVGVGSTGHQVPVLCVEMEPNQSWTKDHETSLQHRLSETQWATVVARCLVHEAFPVDPRHNSKIKREVLREWAQQRCGDLVGVLQ